jgi:hypothetical protein
MPPIRTRNPSMHTAADPRLRTRDHWNEHRLISATYF